MPDISLVVPVYNEEENLPVLHKEIASVLKKMKKSYELLFINDGSTDASLAVMRRLKKKDRHIRIINFYKNFGQTAALSAGFDLAKGKIIITMDADLQNDPHDIPALVKALKEYDVVTGWRVNRKDTFGKKVFSKIANMMRRKLLHEYIHDAGCTLKAYRASVVRDIKLYGEMHRYITSIAGIRGFRVGEIPVNHRERRHGATKYSSRRLVKGFLDLLYIKFWADYSNRALHFFGWMGITQYVLSGLLLIYYLIKITIFGNVYVGPAILLAAILVVTGSLSIVFGFLFELQIRTYYEKHDIKPYNIKEVL